MKLLSIAALLVFCVSSLANAIQPIKDISGVYPILELGGNGQVVGQVEIRVSETHVGYAVMPLKMASHGVAHKELLTPIPSTRVYQVENTIMQRFEGGDNVVVIAYTLKDGFIEIHSEFTLGGDRCNVGDERTRCGNSQNITIATGGSSGELIDLKAFIGENQGSYRVLSAGGIVPKPENESAAIFATGMEGIIVAPYCPPGAPFCDPGYNFLAYETTRIFRREYEAVTVFDLFSEVEGKALYFRWEVEPERILFKNTQYKLESEQVCLEHVLVKK